MYDNIPRSAIASVQLDFILPMSEIASLLVCLTHEPVKQEQHYGDRELEMESGMAEVEMNAMQSTARPGNVSGYSRSDCGSLKLYGLHQLGVSETFG